MKTVVLSLGGSLIVPNEIDFVFLKNFKKIILDFVKHGNRAVSVCGGGKTCRYYQNAAVKLADVNEIERDWVGIKATMLNAQLVKAIFGNNALLIGNPKKKIKTNKKIIIGAGWLPGHSTDADAVFIAKNFKANALINMSNTDYIYDKDPNKFKDAKSLKILNWKNFKKLFNSKWVPGQNVIFDQTATKMAEKLKLEVVFMNGKNLKNFDNFLKGKKFKGSVVS